MAATDKSVEIQDLTAEANNDSKAPEARITACRYLLRLTDRSDRSVRVAKRVAKKFQNDENSSPEVRAKAGRLLDYAIGHEDADSTDDEPEKPNTLVDDSRFAPEKARTHAEIIANYNKHWDDEKSPAKWLYFRDAADLIPFGIPNVDDPNIRYVGEKLEWPFGWTRIVNPRFFVAYKAWKAARFPDGVLPGKDSSWILRYESDFEGGGIFGRNVPYSNVIPEFMRGTTRKIWEFKTGFLEPWEDQEGRSFCRELMFEILCNKEGRPDFISDLQ